MSHPPDESEIKLSRVQKLLVALIGVLFFVWLVWLGTAPLPRGHENRDKVGAFLKEQFPRRSLSPDDTGAAGVAALFHVIRTAPPEKAAPAIEFAAQQRFGYATPYVIERLEDPDPKLRAAAHSYLVSITGVDHELDADAWRGWWRDPPRRLFGILPVGQHSFEIAVPVCTALLGIFLIVNRRRLGRAADVSATALLAGAWFFSFMLTTIRLVGSFDSCFFGAERIVYHASHGDVIGLEEARAGGPGLYALLMVAFLATPFVGAIVLAAVLVRRSAGAVQEVDQGQA